MNRYSIWITKFVYNPLRAIWSKELTSLRRKDLTKNIMESKVCFPTYQTQNSRLLAFYINRKTLLEHTTSHTSTQRHFLIATATTGLVSLVVITVLILMPYHFLFLYLSTSWTTVQLLFIPVPSLLALSIQPSTIDKMLSSFPQNVSKTVLSTLWLYYITTYSRLFWVLSRLHSLIFILTCCNLFHMHQQLLLLLPVLLPPTPISTSVYESTLATHLHSHRHSLTPLNPFPL